MVSKTPSPSVESLYRQATDGDTASFWALVKPHERTIFAVAFGILRNGERAEDVLHDTYVRAFSTIGNLRDTSRVAGWLYSMARNIAYEQVRKNQRQERLLQSPPPAPTVISVPDMMIQEEQMRMLDEAIQSLPEAHRVVLGMKYMSHMSCQDIADTLEIGLEAAKSRLFEARRVLRARLQAAETKAATPSRPAPGGVQKGSGG